MCVVLGAANCGCGVRPLPRHSQQIKTKIIDYCGMRHGTSGPWQRHVRYVQAPSLCRLSQAERGLKPSGRGATAGADIAVTAISVLAVTLCVVSGAAKRGRRVRPLPRHPQRHRVPHTVWSFIFGDARRSHELQIDSSAPAAFYFRLVLKTSCIVNVPRPT